MDKVQKAEKRVLSAARELVRIWIKYGKEYDTELERLVDRVTDLREAERAEKHAT